MSSRVAAVRAVPTLGIKYTSFYLNLFSGGLRSLFLFLTLYYLFD